MISKNQLQENVNKLKSETTEALTLIYESLNQGQQKKLIKNEEVYNLLLRYGVIDNNV